MLNDHLTAVSIVFSIHFTSFAHLLILQQWTGQAVDRHCTALHRISILHHISLLFVIYFPHKENWGFSFHLTLTHCFCLSVLPEREKEKRTGLLLFFYYFTKAANWRFQFFTFGLSKEKKEKGGILGGSKS